jgi:sulfatase maturation enzyme AslB (radical SAM superfamily)
MINSRLFEWYGIDTTKDLHIKTRCPRPFDTVLIDKNGSCFLCECTSWLPQSAGNLHTKSLAEILDSVGAHALRNSIVDGSYRYCNNAQCSYLLDARPSGWSTKIPPVQIKNIRLAIDDSCNLRCPSCRKDLIFYKEGKKFERRLQLVDRIIEWINLNKSPLTIHIGSDGDPFASHVYRNFMTRTIHAENIKYSVLTNALLLKDFAERIPHIIENLSELGVSIDGATKETYEKLRLGGGWQKINDNLQFISQLKKKYNFKFRLHFVVQKDNYHEMEAIIELGKKYGVDRVWLDRIQDWNVMQNFSEQNIFESTDYKMYLEKIKKLVQRQTVDFVECPTLIN